MPVGGKAKGGGQAGTGGGSYSPDTEAPVMLPRWPDRAAGRGRNSVEEAETRAGVEPKDASGRPAVSASNTAPSEPPPRPSRPLPLWAP